MATNKDDIEAVFLAARDGYPAKGWEPLVDIVSDDVVWTGPGQHPDIPWGGTWHGKDGVRSYFEALWGTVDIVAYHPGNHEIMGDIVRATIDIKVRVKRTGKVVALRLDQEAEIRNRQVVRFSESCNINELTTHL